MEDKDLERKVRKTTIQVNDKLKRKIYLVILDQIVFKPLGVIIINRSGDY